MAGAIAAGFDPNDPAIAFRTYKSGTAPFLDIGVNGSGETKLQSATTRVNSGVFQVSSGTQSFTAGAGNFTVNSGAGNIAMGGNNATINMGGSVTISGAGTAGTTVGTTSRPLTLQGNQVKGRNELLWNKVSNTDANEKPFIVEQFSATMSSGDTAVYIDLGRPVRDYSAMVVGWRTGNGVITHQLEAVFTAVDGNWKVKIKRSPSTGAAGYTVTILFINKLMITDPRTVYAEG